MSKWGYSFFCLSFLFYGIVFGQESDSGAVADSVALLMNTNFGVKIVGGDSIIECRFTFNKKVPQYFYDINQQEKKVVLTMKHARCGGFVIPDTLQKIGIGPLKSVLIHEDFININQEIKGMLPVLYSVTVATVKCDPIVNTNGMAVHDDGTEIVLGFNWPSNKTKRNEFYFQKQKSSPNNIVTAISVAGVTGIVVGGFFIWKYMNKKNDSDILSPVLPQHPSTE